jgi:hypothetical protein
VVRAATPAAPGHAKGIGAAAPRCTGDPDADRLPADLPAGAARGLAIEPGEAGCTLPAAEAFKESLGPKHTPVEREETRSSVEREEREGEDTRAMLPDGRVRGRREGERARRKARRERTMSVTCCGDMTMYNQNGNIKDANDDGKNDKTTRGRHKPRSCAPTKGRREDRNSSTEQRAAALAAPNTKKIVEKGNVLGGEGTDDNAREQKEPCSGKMESIDETNGKVNPPCRGKGHVEDSSIRPSGKETLPNNTISLEEAADSASPNLGKTEDGAHALLELGASANQEDRAAPGRGDEKSMVMDPRSLEGQKAYAPTTAELNDKGTRTVVGLSARMKETEATIDATQVAPLQVAAPRISLAGENREYGYACEREKLTAQEVNSAVTPRDEPEDGLKMINDGGGMPPPHGPDGGERQIPKKS